MATVSFREAASGLDGFLNRARPFAYLFTAILAVHRCHCLRRNDMEIAKQLSVRLVNKPGRLSALLASLQKGKVELQALAVMDSGERGTIRFVPDDPQAAIEVLAAASMEYDQTDVLLVEFPSQPGAFARMCDRLASEHLNIDYAYNSFGSKNGGAMAVIRVNNLVKAQRVLSDHNVSAARKAKTTPGRRPVHAR